MKHIKSVNDSKGLWKIYEPAEGEDSISIENSHHTASVFTTCKVGLAQSIDAFMRTDQSIYKDYSYSSEVTAECLSDHDDSFRGGRKSNLLKVPCLKEYQQFKKDMEHNPLFKQLKEGLSEQTLRKRSRDAFDGEYDFDRKWDIEPFTKSKRQEGLSRGIKIYAYPSFPGSVSASEINTFGAMIGAIASLVESSGILAEIIMSKQGEGYCGERSDAPMVYRHDVELKKSDEYLPPTAIVRAFSSSYYRRVGFSYVIHNSYLHGKDTAWGLGAPLEYEKAVCSKQGELHIYSRTAIDDVKNVLDNLKNALGLKQGE